MELCFVDLGSAPPSNAFLTEALRRAPEKWYPLRVLVCENCWLVQTEDFADARELFDAEYAYFSAFSAGWLAHSERYVDDMVSRFGLTAGSHVVEVAANDGYLLQYVRERGIPCTGIEPTASTARAAREKGIPIIEEFFGTPLGTRLARKGAGADLAVANNVLAHVPDINDFVGGFAKLLKPAGVATFEFPHLMKLVSENQFDTIYHEHFSYLSLTAVNRIFRANGLSVFDVESHPTHGGSLRVFAQRSDSSRYPLSARVGEMLAAESAEGAATSQYYSSFQARANRVKNSLVGFLLEVARSGKTIGAYGAAAKGNTLLNYAGVRSDLVQFVVDRNPAKQGKFMPGSRIPIVDEEVLRREKPDFVLILPWNIKTEVMQQLEYIRDWGGRFVVAVGALEVV